MDNLGIAIAIISGLTEVVKRAGVNTKYIPIVAIVFGIIYALAVVGISVESFISGVVAGLTSVGLYRTVQKAVK